MINYPGFPHNSPWMESFFGGTDEHSPRIRATFSWVNSHVLFALLYLLTELSKLAILYLIPNMQLLG